MMRIRLFVAAIAAVILTMCVVPSAGAVTKTQLKAKALSISNFPTGWSVDNSAQSSSSVSGGCLQGTNQVGHGVKVSVKFANGQLPQLAELLATGRGEVAAYNKLNHVLASCKHFTASSNGQSETFTVGAMSFPHVGDRSNAYSVTFSVQGVTAGFDFVLFQVGSIVGLVEYGDIGHPDAASVQAYVAEAVDKIAGKPTVTPTTF